MSRSRGWCFTLNNYTPEDYAKLAGVFNDGHCVYLIVGKEVAPETGTDHLQGFIYFKNAKAFGATKSLLGERYHLEAAKGNIEQNYAYCSKGGNFATWGTRPLSQTEKGEANKARYESAWALAKEGKFEEIDGDIRFKSYRTMKEIYKDYAPRIDDAGNEVGHWIFGEAGVGKSRTARERFPVFYPKLANKWWDGYQREEAVILDDLDPDNAKYITGHLKLWTDRYEFVAESKGGSMRIRPKHFVVTSQYSIAECFSDPRTVAAFKRRFKEERLFQYIPYVRPLPVEPTVVPTGGDRVVVRVGGPSPEGGVGSGAERSGGSDVGESLVADDSDSDSRIIFSPAPKRARGANKAPRSRAERLRQAFADESSDSDDDADLR